VGDRPFPKVTVVDMRKERGWYISDALARALKDRLAKGEQSLLFLNRRGFATQVVCPACGWEGRCPRCKVSLVYHKYEAKDGDQDGLFAQADAGSMSLRCHTCDHRQAFPERCPACNGDVIRHRGRGTQRVEEDLKQLFPAARLLRWDRDTTQRKAAHHRAFQAVRSESVDIVVGTQMIAQGLDFPRVTLGGVLDADRSLRFPDFRAGERAFRLLSQVAGRVGRSDGSRNESPGEVILQTRYPEHYAVKAAQAFDYDAFAEQELAFRREMEYPPFVRLASALVRSKDEAKAEKAAMAFVEHMESGLPPGARVLGPAPAFHHHREGYVQWQVVLKAPGDAMPGLLALAKGYDVPGGAALTVDVDPEDLA
jgi:primosomal protein N' (replication factor Y)